MLLFPRLVGVLVVGLALPVAAAEEIGATADLDPDEARIEIGRLIYVNGLLPSGAIISGNVVGDVELGGAQAICVACHRRSGLGSVEGQEAVPAVTGDLLYQPLRLPTSKLPLAPTLRPAYDDASLKRAIRDGIGSDGRMLGDLMPRYDLTDDQLESLIAYLKSLKSSPAPGVTEREMHFATVIAGAVDPSARKALVDVLEAFFEQKNRETRHETERAAHAPWHKAWVMKPYRKWVHHLWEIGGTPESWPRQLEAKYREQPVFGIVSGLAVGEWKPVHEFCESRGIPCLFPITDLPVVDESAFYSIYFTRGMALEADGVVQHLADKGRLGDPILQVFSSADPRSAAAAAGLHRQVARLGGSASDLALEGSSSPTELEWYSFLQRARGGTLVTWLDGRDLDTLWTAWSAALDEGPARLYLSTSLFGTAPRTIPPELRERVFFVHPYDLPSQLPRRLARASGWMRPKGIEAPQEALIQSNAFFALKAAGEATKRIRGFFNRDYFLERIEHMTENATFTSVYPAVSLAPRQRFISRGVYIAQFPPSGGDELIAVTDWLVPGSTPQGDPRER